MGILPLACTYGESERCLELSGASLQQWMSTGTNPFDPWVRPDLYCAGVKQLGEEAWDFLAEEFSSNWEDDDWQDRYKYK